jgi:hypothetical protein
MSYPRLFYYYTGYPNSPRLVKADYIMNPGIFFIFFPRSPEPFFNYISSAAHTMDNVAEPVNNADIVHPGRNTEALIVGQEFNTFQDFKVAMDKWAVAGRFAIRFEKSDRKRNVVRCKDSRDCVFNVRAMWKAPQEKVSSCGNFAIDGFNPL